MRDFYARKAKSEGFRARSAYKLLNIQRKFHIFKKGYTTLDLGAYPGSWSQVASYFGVVYAVDKKKINPIKNCIILNKDIFDKDLFKYLPKSVDVIISDISPNISGIREKDQFEFMHYYKRTKKIIVKSLKKDGNFVFKVFQGSYYNNILMDLKHVFKIVRTYKPKASKDKSKEMYIIALSYNKTSSN